MEEPQLQEFEDRARLAEEKLQAIEKLLGGVSISATSTDPADLQGITPTPETRPDDVLQNEKQSMELLKAQFRIQHLIASMQQSDLHLKTALFGNESDRLQLREQFSYLQQKTTASGSPRRTPHSPRKA
ncbi:hypothetical protein WJX74_003269 [Apatococcus lobatus]|uniref:Uncharacterized protein n=1 Tax=Apatococcus lobatus TaxID=904363 RepID=A0AAW1RVL6_9CHLO